MVFAPQQYVFIYVRFLHTCPFLKVATGKTAGVKVKVKIKASLR
jgi:hypothetical protein